MKEQSKNRVLRRIYECTWCIYHALLHFLSIMPNHHGHYNNKVPYSSYKNTRVQLDWKQLPAREIVNFVCSLGLYRYHFPTSGVDRTDVTIHPEVAIVWSGSIYRYLYAVDRDPSTITLRSTGLVDSTSKKLVFIPLYCSRSTERRHDHDQSVYGTVFLEAFPSAFPLRSIY